MFIMSIGRLGLSLIYADDITLLKKGATFILFIVPEIKLDSREMSETDIVNDIIKTV